MRHTGIEAIGDVPWGTHFCQFYETDRDLIEMLVPYFEKGLEANEFCMWVTSEPLRVRQAKAALRAAVPDLDTRIKEGQIEIIDYQKWYIRSGRFSAEEVLRGWEDKLDAALNKGYEGLRLSGNTFWLEHADWEDFRRYEEAVDNVIGRRRMLAMCTYSLQKCGASEIIDVVANHEFALLKRRGRWEIIESAARKQAEETLKKETLKYSQILQTANAGFWLVDTEGKLEEVNDAYCSMSGYSRAELLSLRIADLEARETPEEVRDHIRFLREHGHHQFESRHRRKDGTVFDAEIHASFLDIEGGRMVGFTWDISQRKRMEEETRRHAEELETARIAAENEKLRLEAVMEALPVGLAITDARGGNIKANSAFEHIWAGPRPRTDSVRDYAPYKAWWMDSGRPLAPEEWASAQAVEKSEPVVGQMLEIQKFDGSRAFVINSAAPVRDAAGKIVGSAVAIQDITELRLSREALMLRTQELQLLTETLEQRVRQRTAELAEANALLQAEVRHSHIIEADLKQQKETLQTLIDSIPVMLCFYDPAGRAKVTNREFERLLGWTKDEAENLDIAPSRSRRPEARPGSEVSSAESIPGWREHNLRTREGACLESSWATVRLSNGGQIGIGLDMRERREAERERLRLAAAVEQADRGMAITDEAGLIIYANPAFEATIGSARADLLGRRYYDLLAGNVTERSLAGDVEKTVRGGGIWRGCSSRKTRDGQSRELEISVSPIRDRSGQVINNLVVERDITQDVRLQQQLRQAQKLEALGTLAGGIAHDFNNILNPIFINTELVLLDAALDDQSRRELELALKAAERGRDLVRQIITFSRQKEKERRPAQIGPVVKEALKFLRSALPASIVIREHIGPETGFIMADPSQIHQIVMNLCNNSAYAMRERGGVLEVRLAEVQVDGEMALRHPEIKPGPFLRLTVTDTGIGMAPEVVERIFDPFFTTKKPGEGSGMGLAVVHGIVRDNEGAVTVYSEIGKGTTFNIYFPRGPAQEIESRESAEILPEGRERILLVDDDEAQIRSMRNMLERLGHQVVARTNPKEALRVFKNNPARFDLVITDQTMPRLTGAQLSEEILRLRPGLPVILCTGFSEQVDASGAQALGISGFLTKPFSIREMAAAIDQALKRN